MAWSGTRASFPVVPEGCSTGGAAVQRGILKANGTRGVQFHCSEAYLVVVKVRREKKMKLDVKMGKNKLGKKKARDGVRYFIR